MNEQEKQLLLKDLCARLSYHPIVHVEHDIGGFIETADLQASKDTEDSYIQIDRQLKTGKITKNIKHIWKQI